MIAFRSFLLDGNMEDEYVDQWETLVATKTPRGCVRVLAVPDRSSVLTARERLPLNPRFGSTHHHDLNPETRGSCQVRHTPPPGQYLPRHRDIPAGNLARVAGSHGRSDAKRWMPNPRVPNGHFSHRHHDQGGDGRRPDNERSTGSRRAKNVV